MYQPSSAGYGQMHHNTAVAGPAAGYDGGGSMLSAGGLLTTSALGGIAAGNHKHKLGSKGLLGFTTLFTGYDPQHGLGGLGRQMSVGRLALAGVELGAQGLLKTGMLDGHRFENRVRLATQAQRYGLSGIIGARGIDFTPMGSIQGAADKASLDVQRSQYKKYANDEGNLSERRKQQTKKRMTAAAEVAAKPARRQRGSEYRKASVISSDNKVRGWRFFGMFSGEGYDEYGNTNARFVRAAGTNMVVPRPGRQAPDVMRTNSLSAGDLKGGTLQRVGQKSQGMIARGRAGLIGGGIRGLFLLGAAELGLSAATNYAGRAYGSMVRTADSINERTGGGADYMSGAYFGRAAATERQRAVATMNENVLNPRTQLMGNEAFFAHQ